ncbi:uncharacterized protein LOC142350802 isoform X2 [Convolutriloba macropyga]
MVYKWWKENKSILHRNLSQLETMMNSREGSGGGGVSKLRVSKDVIKRSQDLEDGLFLPSLGLSQDVVFDDSDTENDKPSQPEIDDRISRFSSDILKQSSLLEMPPGLDDDPDGQRNIDEDGDVSLGGSPGDSAELSRSYRDDKEILIPGASKSFMLTMPSATPLEQSPLKNMKSSFSWHGNLKGFGNAPNRKNVRKKLEQMNSAEVWEEFLQRQRTEEEFATLSEFYGRHGTAYTKRYSSHARSWGPEQHSTRGVVDCYAACSRPQILHHKAKDRVVYQNLEDFQRFENQMADNRRKSKSATVLGTRKRLDVSPETERNIRSREIRSGKFSSVPSKQRVALRSGKSEISRPSDTNGDTASAAISVGQFEIGDAIDGACNELIINKEQVGPEPSRGFRQPFRPINPFKTIASQTITLTKNRPETDVVFEPPIVLIPGISNQSKRKDPDEFRETNDPMSPRLLPGQRQMLKSGGGGSTSRGNRPYTTIPKTSTKDKWNSHKPSDENDRVKGAANHPFYSLNQNVLEKMVMVNHLGRKRSTPWWRDAYGVSSKEISQYLQPSGQMRGPPPTAEDIGPQADLWGGEATELEPSIEYMPNIASKKNIFTWGDILSATS